MVPEICQSMALLRLLPFAVNSKRLSRSLAEDTEINVKACAIHILSQT